MLDGHAGSLGVHAVYNGLVLSSHDPRVQGVGRDQLRQGLDFAAAGATHMVVRSPFVHHGGPHSLVLTERLLERVHATLDPVAVQAGAQDCLLVFEVVYDLRVDPLVDAVCSFRAAQVRLSLDVEHALVMQIQGAPPPDVWVRQTGDRLAHLHLHDTDGVRDRHCPPGAGRIAWRALFDELRTVARPPHHPRLLLEVKPPETVPAAAWLIQRGFVR